MIARPAALQGKSTAANLMLAVEATLRIAGSRQRSLWKVAQEGGENLTAI